MKHPQNVCVKQENREILQAIRDNESSLSVRIRPVLRTAKLLMNTPQARDQELILEFAREGSQAAFEAFIDRHHEALYRIACFVGLDSGLARQAQKKCFVSALRESYRYNPESSIQAWFHGIVTGVLAKQMAKALHKAQIRAQDGGERPAPILQLSGKDAYVLALQQLMGMDVPELARQFAIPPGEMRARLKRSLTGDAEVRNIALHREHALAVELPDAPRFEKIERDAARQTTSIILAKARFPHS